ncbi:SdpI family protein, partial [Staphylococcus lutrae]
MLLMGLCVLSLATTYLVFFAQKNEVGDKPNFFIGYRTPTSMQSKKVWDFSQKEFKKIFIKTQFLLM